MSNSEQNKAIHANSGDGKTYYHGTNATFHKYDSERHGSASGEGHLHNLKGAWFTDNHKVAESYGKNVKKARLDTSGFHVVDAKGKHLNDFRNEMWDAKKHVADKKLHGLVIKNLRDNADYTQEHKGTHVFVVNSSRIKSSREDSLGRRN